jgi:hypothetical protein
VGSSALLLLQSICVGRADFGRVNVLFDLFSALLGVDLAGKSPIGTSRRNQAAHVPRFAVVIMFLAITLRVKSIETLSSLRSLVWRRPPTALTHPNTPSTL